MTVRCGLDLIGAGEAKAVAGKRIALLSHGAAVTADLASAPDVFMDRTSAEVKLILSPEHGLFGTAQDMVPALDRGYRDVPVLSLYGPSEASLDVDMEMLEGIELLVIDLRDIGTRYYTYAATMARSLKAAGMAGVPALVLDRPNPLGGEQIEGNVLEMEFASFVGQFPIPVRHGMTLGELAFFMTRHLKIQCEVAVLPCDGWRRSMMFPDTGLPWAAPSPNMPTFETALVYPGACLVEGTNLSEGRGTTMPFLQTGAPYLSGSALAASLNGLGLPGVVFRPVVFKPMFQKYAGEECEGVFWHVTDRLAFKPYLSGLALLWAVKGVAPHEFAWRTEPYEFVSEMLAIDLLCGTDRVRRSIESGEPFNRLVEIAAEVDPDFLEARSETMLYE